MTYDLDQLARQVEERINNCYLCGGNGSYVDRDGLNDDCRVCQLEREIRSTMPALLADARLGQEARRVRVGLGVAREIVKQSGRESPALDTLLAAIDGQKE